MGNSKFKLTAVDGVTVELGVVKGVESYDQPSGQLHETVRVSIDELEEALKAARAEGKTKEKDGPALSAHIDPTHPSADSSFRSEDRPPIFISSDTNPSPAHPTSDVPENETIERLPSGLAAVTGNQNFDAAPGPNVPEPPKGVDQPKPKATKPASKRNRPSRAKSASSEAKKVAAKEPEASKTSDPAHDPSLRSVSSNPG